MAFATLNALSPEQKKELATQYAGLVKHIASRMAVMFPSHVEIDDLINDGAIGLMEALNRFDPSKGVKFLTFATNRIRGSILDALRSLDWVSRGGRRRCKEMRQFEDALAHELGRRPTLDELAEFSGLSREELQRRRREYELSQLASLDEVRSKNPDQEDRLSDSIIDVNNDLEKITNMQFRREALLEGLKTLSEREQLVLSLYYFEELNIREIGRILGVSEPRVSQLHQRCIKKLRALLGQGEPGSMLE